MCDQLLLESYKLDKCSKCKACNFSKYTRSALRSGKLLK